MRCKFFGCFIVGMLIFAISGCSGSDSPVSPELNDISNPHSAAVDAALDGVEIININLQSVRLDSVELLPWGFRDIILDPDSEIPLDIGLSNPESEIVLSVDGATLNVNENSVETYRGAASAEFTISNPGERIYIHLETTGEHVQVRDITVRTIPTDNLPIPPCPGVINYTDVRSGVNTDIVEGELLVGFKTGTSLEVAEALTSALDSEILRAISQVDIYRLRIPAPAQYEKFIGLFESSPAVKFAEINSIKYPDIIPNDTYESYEYGNAIMQTYDAWDIHEGTDATIIGVIDSGVMRDHPDLYENVVDGEDFISPIGDGLGGETPGDGQDNNNDGRVDGNVGHGTHCSGIIGAVGNNSEGVSGHTWGTKIMGLRVFPVDGDSGCSESSLVDALVYGADAGCIGLSMSLGGPYGSSAEETAINYAWNNGSVIIAAAGNSNSTGSHYPSMFPNVISVAATDHNDRKASFSNYSSTVDCSAPGVNIMSSYFYTHGGDPWDVPENQRYVQMSGTSMACPQVSGLVGLVASYFPSYSNTEVADQVVFTADNIDVQNPSYVGMLGTGRINDYSALTKPLAPDFEIISLWNDDDNPIFSMGNRDGFINPGEIIEFQPTVRNTGTRSAPDCVLTIDADPGYIELLFDSVDLGTVDRNDIATPENPLIFRINPGLTEDTDLVVDLIYSYSNGDPITMQHTISIKADMSVVDLVDCYGQGLLDGEIRKGIINVPVLEFNIEADTNYATLENLTVHQTGTAGVESFTDVQLWLDSNDDGFFTPSLDTRIAYRSYSNPGYRGSFDDLNDPMNGFAEGIDYTEFPPVYFNELGAAYFQECHVPTSPGVPRTIFVVLGIQPTAITGDTVQVGILSGDDVKVKIPDVVNPVDFPIQSDEVPIVGTWLDPAQLTSNGPHTDTVNSWRAETAVCPVTGNVYVVFDSSRDGSYDIFFRRSANQAESFDPPVKLDNSNANEWYPDVQVDSSGVVHAVWYSTKISNNNREIYYARSFDNGGVFETPVRLTNAVRDSRMPKLAVGPDDSLNIAWHDDRSGDDDYNIYFMRSDDGGDSWGTTVRVADTSNASEEVAIAVGGNGVIHVTWEEFSWYYSANTFYSRSVNDGATWSAPFKVTTGAYNNNGWHSDVTADNLGNVYIAFHYLPDATYAEISIRKSVDSGANWGATFEITDNGVPDSRPAIYATPDGSLVDIVYRSRAIDTWDIFHTYSDDGFATWDEPFQISTSTGGDSREAVVVRAANKNIFAFWEDVVDFYGSYEVFWNRFIY